MEFILIVLTFYIFLFFYDLLPLFKRKEKKYLIVSVPIYAVTLIMLLLIGANTPYVSITSLWESLLGPLIK